MKVRTKGTTTTQIELTTPVIRGSMVELTRIVEKLDRKSEKIRNLSMNAQKEVEKQNLE